MYFVLNIQQMHLHIYMHNKNNKYNIINIIKHNKNTLQLYFLYTKLLELKSAELEQLILRHFNCAEVVLKSN